MFVFSHPSRGFSSLVRFVSETREKALPRNEEVFFAQLVPLTTPNTPEVNWLANSFFQISFYQLVPESQEVFHRMLAVVFVSFR